ncbi:hypothetical protein [Salinigranum sp.]|uniref:hypothetical protein n=1 Tax=Salinigranum sp. TaxID=1966351 RepID=UPI00356308AC
MTPPLADVAFLVRSPNRLAVLKILADGARARAELVEGAPVSRVTVGRIRHDFVGREWVVRTAAGYETTTRWRLLARELSSLRTLLRALDRLDPLVEWVPVDALDVPLEARLDARRLRSAHRLSVEHGHVHRRCDDHDVLRIQSGRRALDCQRGTLVRRRRHRQSR